MQPLFATSYDGLAEGMLAIASWAVAVLILVVGVVLVCLKKRRSAGRRLAILTCITAVPQFGYWIYWLLKDRAMDESDALMLGLSILPIVIAGVLLWYSRERSHADVAPKTA